ncbi:MAG: hypothetical protein ACXWGY_07245, partial [Chthoniobacterales bacterium]
MHRFAGGVTLAGYLANPGERGHGSGAIRAPQWQFEPTTTRFRDRIDARQPLAEALGAACVKLPHQTKFDDAMRRA